jgi:WD40 repeat protein
LWDLETGTQQIIPGYIKQFASDGRRVVVVALAPHRDGLRPWLKAARWLPIVRHWTPDPFVMRSRLLLYDSQTGTLVVASPPQELIEAVTVSRNGRVVATATRKGQIRIWDVPE